MKKENININRMIIRAIAIMEILLGAVISSSFIVASVAAPLGRPKIVYGFVIVASLISIVIGVGLFQYRNWGRKTLIFFAGYVILTKFLIVSHLIIFTGNTVEFVSVDVKDITSLMYHTGILIVLNLKSIKRELK